MQFFSLYLSSIGFIYAFVKYFICYVILDYMILDYMLSRILMSAIIRADVSHVVMYNY